MAKPATYDGRPQGAPNSLSSAGDDARNINARDGHIAPGEIAIGVVIGRASEYFDFFVYAIASVLVFPSVFFPFADRLQGTLYSFAVFSLAFIARPIGTVIFMAIQRRYSREAKLTLALFLLGAVHRRHCLPAHLCPPRAPSRFVLLALLRIGQGIALGGSWDGLPSLLALNAPETTPRLVRDAGPARRAGRLHHRRPACSPTCCRRWSTGDFLDWGWRYPFYVAFAINVVALFARLRLVSTPEYARLLDERELEPTGVFEMVGSQGRNIVIGALAALASYALFHLVTVFPLSWITLYSTALGQRLPGDADDRRGHCAGRRGRVRPDRRPLRPPQHAGHAGRADRDLQRPSCPA